MYSHFIPLSVDAALNNIAYPVEIPEYSVIKPQCIEDGDLENFFIPDKQNMVLSRITIASMIDLCDRVIPFRIMKVEDILEINNFLNQYISQLNTYKELEEANKYLVKANRLSKHLQRSVNILAKTHKDAKKELIKNNLVDLFKTKVSEGSPI